MEVLGEEEKGLVGVKRGRVGGGKFKAACILMEFSRESLVMVFGLIEFD